jgi:ketosteroid isomerase-like protein
MKIVLIFILVTCLSLTSCNNKKEQELLENWKLEILEAEKNFAQMAAEEGIAKAFLKYAAEDAVLMRDEKLIFGKKELTEYFANQASAGSDLNLTWTPDFVDVSSSGDLGYTYGQYKFSSTDSIGTLKEYHGVFHTVWKRQKDNTWRFVWD